MMLTEEKPGEKSGESSARKPVLSIREEDGLLRLDSKECAEKGAGYHAEYVKNAPFPHIVLGNFLDEDVLMRVVRDFPEREKGRFSDAYSQLKTGYKLEQIKSAFIENLLNALNSAAFLVFLENLTGIKGLTNDPYYHGGGLHEIARGGHLSIHADFNIHAITGLRRRLNLILYLNEDWEPSYGGHLELWDRQMKACRKSVSPELGTAVIFNTDTTSYHGHPDPLACPEGRYRRSIALYYYSVPGGTLRGKLTGHTTLFQPRPGSSDASLPLVARAANKVRRLFVR